MTDKKQGIPRGKGLPTIGGSNNEEVIKNAIDTALATLTQHLDPMLNNLGQAIEELQRRVNIVEEVKQVFPAKVDVTVKHEQPQIISKDLTNFIVKEVLKASIEEKK